MNITCSNQHSKHNFKLYKCRYLKINGGYDATCRGHHEPDTILSSLLKKTCLVVMKNVEYITMSFFQSCLACLNYDVLVLTDN